MVFVLVALIVAAFAWVTTAKPGSGWIRWAPGAGWSWSIPVKDD